MFIESEKKILLRLARQSIEYFLDTGKKLVLGRDSSRPVPTPESFIEPRACFVTLTKDFELRGCIGSLEAIRPLYLDVIENAYAAAFEDGRFFSVTKEELSEIHIEVSVLTPPQPLVFSSADELLNKLTVGVDGVIISKGNKSATYLPQVWDEILDKNDFLSSLCLKADLAPDDWQKPGIKVETYQVEIITE
ncbi:MAG: AmmeMemoRadiSam system protein A [Candidatus Magasanikbacteria bacterium]|nr:AmmeMemoRadiSam system protein A [Candidatus Magasanikbacteria bacterium]